MKGCMYMLFEVIKKESLEVVFHTEYISCIPGESELKNIRQSGYRFRINNKIVDKERIIEIVRALKHQGPLYSASKGETK